MNKFYYLKLGMFITKTNTRKRSNTGCCCLWRSAAAPSSRAPGAGADGRWRSRCIPSCRPRGVRHQTLLILLYYARRGGDIFTPSSGRFSVKTFKVSGVVLAECGQAAPTHVPNA
ncbi:unnamed protein product [Chrysodeixis includens]|uniref:Uncharacterized protein n=1 Tax=Chrysodeixis includens TaxID=689277 RepID=A0A9N8PXT4_CHRIL|nr:unnamed protein product [Chrysodeixis includens]